MSKNATAFEMKAELFVLRNELKEALEKLAEAKQDTALLDAIEAAPNRGKYLWEASTDESGCIWLSRSVRSGKPANYPANIRAAMAAVLEVK